MYKDIQCAHVQIHTQSSEGKLPVLFHIFHGKVIVHKSHGQQDLTTLQPQLKFLLLMFLKVSLFFFLCWTLGFTSPYIFRVFWCPHCHLIKWYVNYKKSTKGLLLNSSTNSSEKLFSLPIDQEASKTPLLKRECSLGKFCLFYKK